MVFQRKSYRYLGFTITLCDGSYIRFFSVVKLIFFIFFILTYLLCSVQAEELNKKERVYFNFIDLNNDKSISLDEINQSLQIIFQLIDENQDGKISQEEIIELKSIIESLS